MFLKLLEPFLEGEPDGAGAGSAVADPPASQSDALPPAAPSASPGEPAAADAGEPGPAGAEGGEGEPDGDGEGEPEKKVAPLSEETVAALIELYPDTFREHPKYQDIRQRDAQAAVDKAMADLRQQPEQDPEYVAATDAGTAALGEIFRAVKEADENGDETMARTLASSARDYGRSVEARERQAAFVVADALAESTLAQFVQPGSPEFAAVDTAYSQALDEYGRLAKANTRDQFGAIVPDANARRRALPTFQNRMYQLIAEQARKAGEATGGARAQKAAKANEEIIRSNALTQAEADAAARRNPPPTPGGGARPTTTPALDRALMDRPWREVAQTMHAAGHKI